MHYSDEYSKIEEPGH